jgi:hypothetical protein
MKNYLSFLYYYTFIATVLIFIWAFFFGPRPGGLILVLIFAPVAFYFSIKISRRRKQSDLHETTQQDEKGPYLPPLLFVIILCTLFISAFSISAYVYIENLSGKKEESFQKIEKGINELQNIFEALKEKNTYNDLTSKEISEIRQKILNSKDAEIKTVNSSSAANLTDLGFISIKDKKNQKIDLYEAKAYSSKIVGSILYGQQYLFHAKEGTWYLVVDTNGNEGWVNAQFVNVISESTQ